MKIVFVDEELGWVVIENNGHHYIHNYKPPEVEYEVVEAKEEEVSNEDTIHRD